jgi:hypothetical protein
MVKLAEGAQDFDRVVADCGDADSCLLQQRP